MSARKAIGYSLLVLLVLALIVGGGYLLYRLGYEQGAQASAMGPMMHRFESIRPERIAPWHRPGIRGGFIPRAYPGAFQVPLLGIGLAALGVVALAVTVALLLPGKGQHPSIPSQDSVAGITD
jgi:hypothetical protein